LASTSLPAALPFSFLVLPREISLDEDPETAG
jgi:hypothetical protein